MPLVTVETVRVELPTPGEWVDVKRALSKGDATRIEGAAFKLRASLVAGGAAPDVDASLDYEASVFAGLETGIVAWSFPEPVTPENIRRLSEEDYDVITARVNDLWQPRGADDRKNSRGNGATRSLAAVPSPVISAG